MYSREAHVGIAGIRMGIEIRMEIHFFGAVAHLLFVCVLYVVFCVGVCVGVGVCVFRWRWSAARG